MVVGGTSRETEQLSGGTASDATATDAAAVVRVRILMSLATAEDEVGGDGSDHLRQAGELAVALGEPGLELAAHTAAALRSLRRGRHEEALLAFSAAERLLPHAERRDACNLYLNRGTLHLQRLELSEARLDLERWVQLAEGGSDPEALMMARHNLGYLEYLRGNLPGRSS